LSKSVAPTNDVAIESHCRMRTGLAEPGKGDEIMPVPGYFCITNSFIILRERCPMHDVPAVAHTWERLSFAWGVRLYDRQTCMPELAL
jgi:hypothetical protein